MILLAELINFSDLFPFAVFAGAAALAWWAMETVAAAAICPRKSRREIAVLSTRQKLAVVRER